MKDSTKLKTQLSQKLNSVFTFVDKHRPTVVIVLVGLTISFVSYKAQGFLSPVADNQAYETKKAELNYKTVDYEFVTKLENSIDDTEIDITKNLGSGRANPFGE